MPQLNNAMEGPAPRAPIERRRPIQRQLLWPLVALVLLTSALATVVTSVWVARRVRLVQEQALRQAAQTLSEATFPLNDRVLTQMKGLSGVDFVLLGPDRAVRAATTEVPPEWLAALRALSEPANESDGVGKRALTISGRTYLVEWIAQSPRAALAGQGALYLLAPEDQLSSQIRAAILPALVSGAVAAGVSLALATWLARRFAAPIRTLERQTARISGGEFTALPAPPRNDEFRDLAESINQMAERLAAYEQQVRQHERVQSLGYLAAAMAHQLRNTATGGRIAVELHMANCPLGASDETLDVAMRQARLMESYLRQFLSLGQPAVIAREAIHVGELVHDAVGLLRPLYEHADVELHIEADAKTVTIEGDRESLRQLVTNLLINALEAVQGTDRSPRRVTVRIRALDNGGGRLVVEDTGPGPPDAVQAKLFQSFVTSKPNGVGLGLYCAQRVAESHGGLLHWERSNGATRFAFDFPDQRAAAWPTS